MYPCLQLNITVTKQTLFALLQVFYCVEGQMRQIYCNKTIIILQYFNSNVFLQHIPAYVKEERKHMAKTGGIVIYSVVGI